MPFVLGGRDRSLSTASANPAMGSGEVSLRGEVCGRVKEYLALRLSRRQHWDGILPAVVDTVRRLNSGDLEQRAPVGDEDGWGELALAFNEMAGRRAQRIQGKSRGVSHLRIRGIAPSNCKNTLTTLGSH